VQLDAKDADGNTALALATYYNHQACSLALLQANANIFNDMKVNKEKERNELKKLAFTWKPLRAEMPLDVRECLENVH
jgi:hypothetical protein